MNLCYNLILINSSKFVIIINVIVNFIIAPITQRRTGMKKTVIELFAGVGGFRVGLNNIKGFNEQGKAIENRDWDFVWANQWEPSTKIQHAYDCYVTRFGNELMQRPFLITVYFAVDFHARTTLSHVLYLMKKVSKVKKVFCFGILHVF